MRHMDTGKSNHSSNDSFSERSDNDSYKDNIFDPILFASDSVDSVVSTRVVAYPKFTNEEENNIPTISKDIRYVF